MPYPLHNPLECWASVMGCSCNPEGISSNILGNALLCCAILGALPHLASFFRAHNPLLLMEFPISGPACGTLLSAYHRNCNVLKSLPTP